MDSLGKFIVPYFAKTRVHLQRGISDTPQYREKCLDWAKKKDWLMGTRLSPDSHRLLQASLKLSLGSIPTHCTQLPFNRCPSTEQRTHWPSASQDTRAPKPLPHGTPQVWLTTSAALTVWCCSCEFPPVAPEGVISTQPPIPNRLRPLRCRVVDNAVPVSTMRSPHALQQPLENSSRPACRY